MDTDAAQSGLPLKYVQEFLAAIREIASLPENAAMAEADRLLAQILTSFSGTGMTGEGWEQKHTRDAIDRFRAQIERVRSSMGTAQSQLLWDARSLEQEAQFIDSFLNSATRLLFAAEVSTLRAEAKKVAEAAQIAGHRNLIKEYQTRPIHNASSVKSVITGIDESLKGLDHLGALTDEIKAVARSGKERCVRYRFQRKVDEAEVAQGGGNEKRAERLRREAAVLLAQDWSQAFPGETPPEA